MACNLTITVPDGDGVLKNTDGTELSTTPIPSGASADIVAPDATAVVKDTGGNILATENIPSGVSEDIIVAGGGAEVLYTYPYGSLNTGINVTFVSGDDKDVRDNVFNPEIATWPNPTTTLRVYPSLNGSDHTLLDFGVNPDGSGFNIFGNLERFTDTSGGQIYSDGLVIDHYLGLYINKDYIATQYPNWVSCINAANIITIGGKSGFHLLNTMQAELISKRYNTGALNYPPFNFSLEQSQSNDVDSFFLSTSSFINTSVYTFVNDFNNVAATDIANSMYMQARPKTGLSRILGFVAKKAFQYNATTKEMELL